MKKIGGPGFLAGLSLLLLFYVVVIRLHFVVLPVVFLALGFIYLCLERQESAAPVPVFAAPGQFDPRHVL